MRIIHKTAGLLLAVLFLLSGCASSKNVYQRSASEDQLQGTGYFIAGEYKASAWGFAGTVTVEAQFSETDIIRLRIEGPEESGKGNRAIRKLCDRILERQSPEVDAVSGATMTSNAVIKAAKSCFNQAEVNSQN
ncbi:MAG: FMN-binding protein [Oscillospiraceae bacterium]|nr:FMN-binding protein [Oscillospiraceae bacterium]